MITSIGVLTAATLVCQPNSSSTLVLSLTLVEDHFDVDDRSAVESFERSNAYARRADLPHRYAM
jgi:hypothetical protein